MYEPYALPLKMTMLLPDLRVDFRGFWRVKKSWLQNPVRSGCGVPLQNGDVKSRMRRKRMIEEKNEYD
ncbi:unnamed protein product [Lathyrus oleraceus]